MPRPPKGVVVNKEKFNVYLDIDLVKEAHEYGLNISKISENALRMYVDALKKSGVSTPSSQQSVS